MHITVNKLHRVIIISNSEKTFCEINYFLKSLPHKKWSFPLMISSVNVPRNCDFGRAYWINP